MEVLQVRTVWEKMFFVLNSLFEMSTLNELFKFHSVYFFFFLVTSNTSG